MNGLFRRADRTPELGRSPWLGPESATLDGPLVFVWHWIGGNPTTAVAALLGGGELTDILARGGVLPAGVPVVPRGVGIAPDQRSE